MKKSYYLSWYSRVPLIVIFTFFPFVFISDDKFIVTNRIIWNAVISLMSAWVVLSVSRSRVEFLNDHFKIYSSFSCKEIEYSQVVKLTVLNFDKYRLIPFYFRVYYRKEDNEEKFVEISSKEFAINAFRILEEFKGRGCKVIKLEDL